MNNNSFCQECGRELTPDAYCIRCNKHYGIQSFSNVTGSPFVPMSRPIENAQVPAENFIPPTRLANVSSYVSPYLPNNVTPNVTPVNQINQPPAQFANAPIPVSQRPVMPVNPIPRPTNPQRKVAFGWLIASFVSFLVMLLPFMVEMDMMNGGFALVFFSFIFLLTALITSGIFFVRAKTLDKLLSGQELLTYWAYTPTEWATYTEAEFQIAKGEKVPLLILTSTICLIMGVIFAIADPKAGLVVLGVMLGLIALLSLIVFVAPRLRHKKNQNSLGYAYIGNKGVYLNGVFHNWNMLGARVDSVSIEPEAIPMLAITYSYPARTGRQEETVRVPIPQGQFPIAENIIRYFQNIIGR